MRRLLAHLWCPLALAIAAPAWAQAPPPPHPGRILVFSRTTGFRHDSIPVAVTTLARVAQDASMVADHTEDPAAFTAGNLARYRMVVFASTTGTVLDPSQKAALEGFIRGGGGFMGLHAAADTEYDWPWYGRLVGAWFLGHPVGLQSTQVQPERGGRAEGTPWQVTDEIYNYRTNPRPQVQVVATVDESGYDGGTMGADHPITWCHAFDGGRSWYTGLGHEASLYTDPGFIASLERGLRYAAGGAPRC